MRVCGSWRGPCQVLDNYLRNYKERVDYRALCRGGGASGSSTVESGNKVICSAGFKRSFSSNRATTQTVSLNEGAPNTLQNMKVFLSAIKL